MNAPAVAPALVVTMTVDALRALVDDAVATALARHDAERLPPTDLVSGQEMARRIDVSRATLHRLRHEGCPAVAIGDGFKYEPAAVVAWLRARNLKARPA